jgi:hypothetical protein
VTNTDWTTDKRIPARTPTSAASRTHAPGRYLTPRYRWGISERVGREGSLGS